MSDLFKGEPSTPELSRPTPAQRKSRARKASPVPPSVVYADDAQEDATIAAALDILARRMGSRGSVMDSPMAVRKYCQLSIADRDHEVFGVLFLDNQHRLIASECMFRGTLTQTSVYPREVVKAALTHNAAALILYHNHPSGVAEPSRADEVLTRALAAACALVDVRVLDHMVVTPTACASFAERGLL
jgi:DNA repair protein RadC